MKNKKHSTFYAVLNKSKKTKIGWKWGKNMGSYESVAMDLCEEWGYVCWAAGAGSRTANGCEPRCEPECDQQLTETGEPGVGLASRVQLQCLQLNVRPNGSSVRQLQTAKALLVGQMFSTSICIYGNTRAIHHHTSDRVVWWK